MKEAIEDHRAYKPLQNRLHNEEPASDFLRSLFLHGLSGAPYQSRQ